MKTVAIAAITFVAVAILGFASNALGLVNLQFWGPKFEDARRQISEQSQRRVEGVSQGLAALCLNMKTSKDADTRKAFANMIIVQAAGQPT